MPAVKKTTPKRATAAQIRSTGKVPEEEILIPEWGATVLVRGLSFNAQMTLVEETDGTDFNARLMASCIVEPAITLEDAQAIMDGPVAIGNALIEAINRCNGEGASEEALKTFPAGASE